MPILERQRVAPSSNRNNIDLVIHRRNIVAVFPERFPASSSDTSAAKSQLSSVYQRRSDGNAFANRFLSADEGRDELALSLSPSIPALQPTTPGPAVVHRKDQEQVARDVPSLGKRVRSVD